MPNLNKLEPPMACSITNAHNDYDEPSEADIKEAELKAAEVYRSRFFENNDLGYVCEMLERVSDENIETASNIGMNTLKMEHNEPDAEMVRKALKIQ